jgi:hypothetical protein
MKKGLLAFDDEKPFNANPQDVSAPEITLGLPDLPETAFSLVLLPKGGGKYAVLGSRPVSAKTVERYGERLREGEPTGSGHKSAAP